MYVDEDMKIISVSSKQIQEERKELRGKLVTSIINKARKLGISDNALGYSIRAIHYLSPVLCFMIILVGSYNKSVAVFIYLLIALIAFLYFDGCFLSIIEYKLSNMDMNMVDPFLLVTGYERINKNRYNCSLILATIYLSILSIIFYIRFYR